MKRGKSAQSEIITTVLIILLVLAAIVIVWNVVKKTVVTGTEKIDISKLITNLEIQEVNLWVTGGAEVKVKRGTGSGELDKLKFIFYNEDGESVIVEEDGTKGHCNIPNELETKICSFSAEEVNLKVTKVSVVPVFEKSKLGMEISGDKPNTNLPVTELVSWWKFDETSGTTATDSARTNPGILNGATWTEDIERGRVLNFDGTDDYVKVVDDNVFDLTDYSLSVWVRTNSANDAPRIINQQLSVEFWLLGLATSSGNAKIYDSYSGGALESSSPVIDNQWHHIVGVRDIVNNLLTIYVDGVESNSQPVFITTSHSINKDVYIGSYIGSSKFFKGLIDDVMIYDKALSEDEITALYNNQK